MLVSFPFLQDLVPESCCRIVGFSPSYKESYVCNFLGLAVGVELPPHIVASELHVLLDILPPLRRHYSREDPRERERSPSSAVDALWNYTLMVYSAQQRTVEQKCVCVCVCACKRVVHECVCVCVCVCMQESGARVRVCVQVCVCVGGWGSIERCWFCCPFLLGPVFLQRLVALLTSEVLSNVMVSRALASLKEEWMK